jgi:hypothetical protein
MSDPVARMIAEHLRDQARWHLERARRYPDNRHAEAAAALGDAATFIEQLPHGDLRVRQIDAACRVAEVGEFVPGDRAVGFIRVACLCSDRRGGSPESFVERMAKHCVEDAVEFSREFGDQKIE